MAMAARTLLASLGVLLLAAAVCAQDKLDKLDKRASADADIDRLTDDALAGIATFAKDTGLVSLNLPDVDQHFSTTVAWILSITGNLQLMNGLLTNFQTIHRFEDSRLTFIESTQADNPNELVLRVGIEIPEIDAAYDFRVNAGVVTQSGKIDVSVAGLKASTMMVMNMNTLKLSMADLKVADMGKINVKVKDGVVGWLATFITNLVVGFVKNNVKNAIEHQLPSVINDILAKLDIADMIRPHLAPRLAL